MGTRNLTIVISDGKPKIAQYGQWDGYPSGQGATALSFLNRVSASAEFDRFKDRVNTLEWLNIFQSKKIDKDPDWEVKYPYLSRDCGADILNAVYYEEMSVSADVGERKKIKTKVVGLVNNYDFAGDSLFCEWAYVIDLDKNTFEVYKGFNQKPLTEKDRFYPLQVTNNKGYYPVKLKKSYPLDKLPTLPQLEKIK